MPPRKRQTGVVGPRREKPSGASARFADARKNHHDLLADCERLLLREAVEPQQQNGGIRRHDVIHPSEMSHSDWCPRATFLRILHARAGTLPAVEPHRFQLENIFEEGHEYHRKWQARFRRMGRLQGRWMCEACGLKWFDVSPERCLSCGAPAGAVTYLEVPLHDREHLISGSADGEVMAVDWQTNPYSVDELIEVKSIGEGTVRMELPRLLMKHTHEVPGEWGKTSKVLDTRGVWRDITSPFGPHLRQGFIYLRLRGLMSDAYGLSPVDRITFIYEFKPTSMVKAFTIKRDDEAVQDLWDSCADIVYALDRGGREPRCVDRNGSCKQCAVFQEQESDHDGGAAKASREAEGEPAGRGRDGEAEPADPSQAEDRDARASGRPDRPRRLRADGPAGPVHEVGGLLGRPARGGRRR